MSGDVKAPDNTRVALELPLDIPLIKLPNNTSATNNKNKKNGEKPGRGVNLFNMLPLEMAVAAPTDNTATRGTFTGTRLPMQPAEPEGRASGYIPEPLSDSPAPRGGNALYRALAPSEDELEAARNGLRWHWALEHRFMPPGSKWNDTVWNGVDRENAWLRSMLSQTPTEKANNMMSPLAQVRLRGQWLSERNKAINDYINGNWDDPERAYKDFQDAISKIDEKLISLGEDPALLRPVPPVAGKRATFTTAAAPVKLRKTWNYAKSVNDKLQEWIDSGKINDPEFMKSQPVKNYLDAVSETVVKYLKESANSMADAEKKRLQILMLTDEGYDAVEKTVKAYQKALTGVMSSASAKEWSQNNKGKVNEVIKALGFTPGKNPDSLGAQLAAIGGVIASSLARNDELPHDVAVDLEAVQSQFETYMENMMLAANVDPRVVAQMAKVLGDMSASQYNDQAFAASRGIADSLGTLDDYTNKIPKSAVKMSRLLEEPKFVWPSLAPDPGNIKVSTAPQSEGENNPSSAYAGEVPGISIER